MKSARSKLPSSRADLSNTGMCGSMLFSSTSQAKVRRGAIGGVGNEPLGPDMEALLRSLDHSALSGHFGLSHRGRRLDIDDHRVIEVDQVVGAVGIEGRLARRRGPARRRVGEVRSLRRDWRRTTERSIVEHIQILTHGASRRFRWQTSSPGTERCRWTSARIRLASTAKPSPPTNPSAMQRSTVISNSSRSRSLSRKRPCRFFEKVE